MAVSVRGVVGVAGVPFVPQACVWVLILVM